jgi:phage tail-like protein
MWVMVFWTHAIRSCLLWESEEKKTASFSHRQDIGPAHAFFKLNATGKHGMFLAHRFVKPALGLLQKRRKFYNMWRGRFIFGEYLAHKDSQYETFCSSSCTNVWIQEEIMQEQSMIRQHVQLLGLICTLFLVLTGCGRELGAAPFSVNPHRVDPYKNFKFRVKWDNQYISGVSSISPLTRTTEVIMYREGGDVNASRPTPGKTTFAPLILKRGRTHDPAFEDWANLVWYSSQGSGTEMSLKNFRKDILVELRNEAGSVALVFHGHHCWPSQYVPLSELQSTGEASVAMETLTIQCEGWERDVSIPEPQEK